MLVAHVIGNCPGCRRENCFGNVDVGRNGVLRGCRHCRYSQHMCLPPVRKKVIYLDQFFFSGAFRGGDDRFVRAANRIAELAEDQLIVAPYSSIHEDETHLWPGYAELLEFIKKASRGAEFEAAYEIERKQIYRAFGNFRQDGAVEQALEREDALASEHVFEWDNYLWIDVGRYHGDPQLLAEAKQQSVERLVDEVFPNWRLSQATFEQDVVAECNAAARALWATYSQYVYRLAHGDFDALLDAPIMSQYMQGCMHLLPDEMSPDEKTQQCVNFLMSEHFRAIPTQWLTAHMWATLKAQVKAGSYQRRDRALSRLSGVYFDIKHISTYAPYVDAFIMDRPMAELVSYPGVNLEARYSTRVFSLTNWDQLFEWLDELQAGMSDEQRQGILEAYPYRRNQ
jgi:hypothetical protein